MGKSQGDGEASGWSNNSESIHIQKNGNLVIKCFCLIKIKKSLTALTEVTLVSLSLSHTHSGPLTFPQDHLSQQKLEFRSLLHLPSLSFLM